MHKQKTIDALLLWLEQTLPASSDLLLPVSGGSDSAFCFWLCNQRLDKRTKGIFIGSEIRCQQWFTSVGDIMYSEIEYGGNNPEVQRWAHFLGVALLQNRILVGSRNLTETTLGTFSNASRVAAFLPLAGLWKSEVMELCEYIGVPEEVLKSSKQADPECGRPQSLADIQFTVVDAFLKDKLGITTDAKYQPTPEQFDYLNTVFKQNSYKASLPVTGPSAV